jgi:beta-lactamase superfamily II metal-dependent hydrolase
MFTIEMLPAGYGDCLLVEYGDNGICHRVLIDGGLSSTYDILRGRIERLPAGERHFELFIITHIDADHIEGAIRLIGSVKTLGITFGDIWFNGWKHLPGSRISDDEYLNGKHGEFLSALIKENYLPWNSAFGSAAVVILDAGPLPQRRLPGGLKLTLLSPSIKCLNKLRPKWDREVRKAGLDRNSTKEVLAALEATRKLKIEDELLAHKSINIDKLLRARFSADTSEANGSSIAVLAEYGDKSCLLTGDAWAPVLSSSVERLLKSSKSDRLRVDALKLPHHGSRANINVELLDMLHCCRYLFSSNGHKYGHPDLESVARVISRPGIAPSLYFNYRTEINSLWDNSRLSSGKYQYKVYYPESDSAGIRIEL